MKRKNPHNNSNELNEKVITPTTLICFSHLRWDFVYQRPQHLLSRFASIYFVYFVEEPVYDDIKEPVLSITSKQKNLWVVKPHLPHGTHTDADTIQKQLLDKFIKSKQPEDLIFWYYTPMALAFTAHHKPALTVYDCMDELSNFKFAPPTLTQLEADLFKKAEVVFTGGHSLYEHKKMNHSNIHPFPSSIDKAHFGKARKIKSEPEDQAAIEGIKLGFYGVLDERFDIELIKELATRRPDWNIVLLGPIAKIDPRSLPQSTNVHLLGNKSYQQLPEYLSGWDVALIPFAINESTEFISPTKTPEYLSAGVPAVSTPIRDVICPYGKNNLVSIASTAEEFEAAIEASLTLDKQTWLTAVDAFLDDKSWDNTFREMLSCIKTTHLQKLRKKTGYIALLQYESTMTADAHNIPADRTVRLLQQSAAG